MPHEAIGYLRVSTTRQATEGVSLDAQRQRIERHCAAHGLQLVACYEDAGLSGRRAENRPALETALGHACRERCTLVVYSLTRLARSTHDAIVISDRLSKAGAELASLTEQLDTTTAAGKMFFRLMSVLSEFESDQISERVRTALSHQKRNGKRYCLHAPFGYTFDGDYMIPNESEQAVLRQMQSLRKGGASYGEIARTLTSQGVRSRTGRPFTAERTRRIVSRQERDDSMQSPRVRTRRAGARVE